MPPRSCVWSTMRMAGQTLLESLSRKMTLRRAASEHSTAARTAYLDSSIRPKVKPGLQTRELTDHNMRNSDTTAWELYGMQAQTIYTPPLPTEDNSLHLHHLVARLPPPREEGVEADIGGRSHPVRCGRWCWCGTGPSSGVVACTFTSRTANCSSTTRARSGNLFSASCCKA